jgi:hypothetical protein
MSTQSFSRHIPIRNSSSTALKESDVAEDRKRESPPEPSSSATTTTKSTTKPMHLPMELWMRVLESLSHENTLARPAYVNCFVKAIIQHGATEEDLVGCLPEFERRAWKTTRPYYAINSTIRKAVQQVFLSGVMLQTCAAPLTEIPQKRKGKRTPRRMKGLAVGNGSEQPFWVPDTLAKMQAKASDDGVGFEPAYLPLDLFDALLFKQSMANSGKDAALRSRDYRPRNLNNMLCEHVCKLKENESLFRTVRRVELLAAAPYEDLMDDALGLAILLKGMIEKVWEDLMIEDGEVRILH